MQLMQPVTRPIDEDEHIPVDRILSQAVHHQPTQAVKALAHIRRLAKHKVACPCDGGHQPRRISSAINAAGEPAGIISSTPLG